MSVFFVLRWLLKKEIRRQFFVLVACEVRLNYHVSFEAKTAKLLQSANGMSESHNAYSLDCLTLLLVDKHLLSSWRCWCIIVGFLT